MLILQFAQQLGGRGTLTGPGFDDFTLVEETDWLVSSTSLRYKWQRFERA